MDNEEKASEDVTKEGKMVEVKSRDVGRASGTSCGSDVRSPVVGEAESWTSTEAQ